MSLIFNRIERKNISDPDGPTKWFPILKSRGMMTDLELAKELADKTTLNPMEARMALYQLQKVVIKALMDGKTVSMGELGNFRLTLSATGSDDKESADHTMINKINLRFTPAKPIKESIAKAHFGKAIDLVSEK